MPDDLLARLRAGKAAGVLLFKGNVGSQQQAVANAIAIHDAAIAAPFGAPAIIAIDQEGGTVKRVPGPPSLSAAAMGQLSDIDIEATGAATGANLLTWGINVDLAPVADVARPGTFEERQRRSFSQDAARAASAVSSFVGGLHRGGVAATLKHYPGLGAATLNTDSSATSVSLGSQELRDIDTVPFTAGIDAGAELVMMSSASYPAWDDQPAVFSQQIIRQVLRTMLGFDGVVVSDALGTPALADGGSVAAQAVRASLAGVDLFIAGEPQACVDIEVGVRDAIGDGRIPRDSALASWSRIQQLRAHLPMAGAP